MRQLGQRTGDGCLVHFLKGPLAIFRNRGIARNQQYWAFCLRGGVERSNPVRDAGAGREHGHANLARDLRPCIRHEDGRGLVPDMNDANACVDARVIQRHDLVAGQTEDGGDAATLQGGDDQL